MHQVTFVRNFDFPKLLVMLEGREGDTLTALIVILQYLDDIVS